MTRHLRATPRLGAGRVTPFRASGSRLAWPLAVATAVTLAGCATQPAAPPAAPAGRAAQQGPTSSSNTVSNCGVDVPVSGRPSSIVTLDQGATELALALGLQDRMSGTAHLDGPLSPTWARDYDDVPVLAPLFPSRTTFLAAKPDLAYATDSAVFSEQGVGYRVHLQQEGIQSYVSPFACADWQPVTFDLTWQEITEFGALTGTQQAARQLVARQRVEVKQIRTRKAGSGLSVFWYARGDEAPHAGVNGGPPQLILDTVGADNVFADVPGGYADLTWEQVAEADPDVIVVTDDLWSPARAKIDRLSSDPALQGIRAVKEKRFVVVPSPTTVPGVRLAEGARIVSGRLAAVNR